MSHPRLTRPFTRCPPRGFATDLFRDQLVVVSGGTGGIGVECARILSQCGARVAILSRSLTRATTTATSITNAPTPTNNDSANDSGNNGGSRVRGYECDVTDEKSIRVAISAITADFATDVTALICAHGQSADSLAVRTDAAMVERLVGINTLGSLSLARSVYRSMLSHRSGSIIFLGSVIGARGNIGQLSYSVSKSALVGATKTLAKEWARANIRVNLVQPGLVQTPMTDGVSASGKHRWDTEMARKDWLARIAQPDEVANVCVFLASDLSTYMTGSVVDVTGGM